MKTPRTSLSLAFSVSALAGLDGFGFRLFLPVVVSRLVARKRSYRAWASGSPAVALSSLASSSNDRLRASPVEWPFSCRAASSDRPDCVPTAVLPLAVSRLSLAAIKRTLYSSKVRFSKPASTTSRPILLWSLTMTVATFPVRISSTYSGVDLDASTYFMSLKLNMWRKRSPPSRTENGQVFWETGKN